MKLMNDSDPIYSLTVEDVQCVAEEVIGRKLSEDELSTVIDPIADNIAWFDAIATAIERTVQQRL